MIQIAINGNRKQECVPKTTEEIVKAAALAITKGASSIHFHPRDENGNETLEAHVVEAQISEIRKKLKNVPLGISTGEWIEPDLEKRLQQIKSWKLLPDFVSVNYDESGFEEVIKVITEKGIKIEVGLSNLVAVRNFFQTSVKGEFLRILIEPPEQDLKAALSTLSTIESLLISSGIKLPVLLHGVDKTCWELVQVAFVKEYQTRIGFEDVLKLPNGERAKDNVELLEQALRIKADC